VDRSRDSDPQAAASPPPPPVALVTGASAGLGWALAEALRRDGYALVLVGRDAGRLEEAAGRLAMAQPAELPIDTWVADVTDADSVAALFAHVSDRFGRLDLLVNNVGQSDRGLSENLRCERLRELLETNVVASLRCAQAALPLLRASRGQVVNIGSLAAKVGARYLGGYPAAKHALAGLTQQMRLEWRPDGVNVMLVSPGPIRRDDAGRRYADQLAAQGELPAQARRPGGGTTVKGVSAEQVARRVMRAVRRRHSDVIIPAHLRPLVAIGHLAPALGDWLLLRFTRTSSSPGDYDSSPAARASASRADNQSD
jgi:uncharacterized protein